MAKRATLHAGYAAGIFLLVVARIVAHACDITVFQSERPQHRRGKEGIAHAGRVFQIDLEKRQQLGFEVRRYQVRLDLRFAGGQRKLAPGAASERKRDGCWIAISNPITPPIESPTTCAAAMPSPSSAPNT